MILRFKISYFTHWGQRLFVVGNVPELGNDDTAKAVPLNFVPSETWELEVAVKASAKKELHYRYFLRDENTQTETWEWGDGHTVVLDAAKCDVVTCIDAWNSPSILDNTFMTAPFREVLLKNNYPTVKAKATKKVTHIFSVKAPLLTKNEAVCIVGNCAALGGWQTDKALPLACAGTSEWTLQTDITDADGRITIPGFYDDVEEVSPAEREMIARIPFDEEKYKRAIDVDALFGEKGYSTLERNSCRPSFDICGIWGGYIGEGSKTVLPSKAYAKVSARLVPHQDPAKINQLFMDYIARVTPPYVRVKVTPSHGGLGYVCPIDLPAYQAAEQAVAVAFGQKPLAVRRGGSIPIISTFEQVLGIKTVLMGFGLEQNAIHSPNESQELEIFFKGIESVAEFYRIYK